MAEETVVTTPEEASKEAEIESFLTTRKAEAEKAEKRSAQLADARAAKAAKKAEPAPADASPEAKQDAEIDEFVAKRADPVLKGKPKPEAKPEATVPEEDAPEAEPEGEPEEEAPDTDEEPEPEPKKLRAEEAKKFAALARREKAVVEREKAAETALRQVQEHAAKVEQQARQFVEQERQRLAAKAQEYDQFRQLFERNRRSPRGLLEMAGFSVKDAVDEVVQEQTPQAVITRDLERQMAEFRRETEARLEAERRAREEAESRARAQAEAAAISQFRADINEFIAGNSDKYELITLYGDHDRVWRTIEQHFQQHGVLPEIEDAADAVEADLYEKSKKVRGAKKFRSEEGTAARTQDASPKQEQKPAARARAATTLTNDMVSSPRTERSGDPLLDLPYEDAIDALVKKHRMRRTG